MQEAALSDQEFFFSKERRRKASPRRALAVSARYDRRASRIIIRLKTGLELGFAPTLVKGLAGASPEALSTLELSPSGFGVHWPSLGVDLFIPGLLEGIISTGQTAAELGAIGGRARSAVKAASSRINGRKGGRPRKTAVAEVKARPEEGDLDFKRPTSANQSA